MARKKISKKTKDGLFYDCSFVCVICQSPSFQIHHIDGDNSNNDESNLAPLCAVHHDEAHTTRENTTNLTADIIKSFKQKWVQDVKERREKLSTCHGNSSSYSMPIWGYINHNRIIQLPLPASKRFQDIFKTCINSGLVDQHAIVIIPKQKKNHEEKLYRKNTVYEKFRTDNAQRIHKFYSEFVDNFVQNSKVIYIEKHWWTKSRIRNLTDEGKIIFLNTNFYFQKRTETIENQQRYVYTKKGKVKIEFYIDTKFMFGCTSIEISFKGHKTCAALLIVKSVNETANGIMVLECTPLALGVSFNKFYPNYK